MRRPDSDATEAPNGTAGSVHLARLTWPVVHDRAPLVLVPIGSVEQHGPHLPLATDTVIAAEVTSLASRQLLRRGVDVVVAPALGYGASGEHEGFAGTISIGHEALHLLLVEYGRSACRWALGVVFVNGHGGNTETGLRAVETLRSEGRTALWATCAVPGGDAHAGATETSVMRHLLPAAVHLRQAVAGPTTPIGDLMPVLRAVGVRAVSPNGVLGDATASSLDRGRKAVELMVRTLVDQVSALEESPRSAAPG